MRENFTSHECCIKSIKKKNKPKPINETGVTARVCDGRMQRGSPRPCSGCACGAVVPQVALLAGLALVGRWGQGLGVLSCEVGGG